MQEPGSVRRVSEASILSSAPSDAVSDLKSAWAELCMSCFLLLRTTCCGACRRRGRCCCRGRRVQSGSESSEGTEERTLQTTSELFEKLKENRVCAGLRYNWLRLRSFSLFGLSSTELELEEAEARVDEVSTFAVDPRDPADAVGGEGPTLETRSNPSPSRMPSKLLSRTRSLEGLADRHTHQAEMRLQMRDKRVKMSSYDAIEVDAPPGKCLIRALSVGAELLEYGKLFIAVWGFSTSLCFVGYWQALRLPPILARASITEGPLKMFLQVDLVADIILMLFLCLQLRTTIINAATGKEFCKGSSILAMNFGNLSLWLDLVSCTPTTLWSAVFGIHRPVFALKMARAWRVFKTPAAHEFRSMRTFFLLRMVFTVFMGAHLLGTMWFLIVYEADDVLERQMADRGDLVQSYHACELGEMSLANCLWTYFSVCLHQGMYLLLGLDRIAYSEHEHLLLAFCTPVGLFVNVYVLGEILVLVQRESQLRTERAASKQWKKEAMDVMQLPSNLRTRVEAYFTFQQIHRIGRHFKQFFADLSPQLHFEVSMHLYANLLWSSRLFHNLRPRVLRELVMMLEDVIYEPGDWICRQGDVGASMYFVVKGLVVMLHHDLETVLKTLRKSSYFGEVSLLLGVPWAVYVRANSFCILARLNKERFATLFERWPQDVEVILHHHSMESQLSRQEVKAKAFSNFGLQVLKAEKPRQAFRRTCMTRFMDSRATERRYPINEALEAPKGAVAEVRAEGGSASSAAPASNPEP